MSKPILWIVIPCYNEEQVLPITAPMFLEKIKSLTAQGLVSEKSRVLFVNDGSRDKTWELIQGFAAQDEHFIGISQSRNRGHQNAVLAGLMEALHSGTCDITISIDCDGQDDAAVCGAGHHEPYLRSHVPAAGRCTDLPCAGHAVHPAAGNV